MRQIPQFNKRLGAELGRTIDNQPLYKWMWSEDPNMMHPMRVPGYDYQANDAGIIEAKPIYRLRKMCLNATNQWVLCHWLESPSEDEWRQLFGYSMEWPKGGQYYPTNVSLDPDELPSEILTQTVIDFIREDRRKKAADVEREAAEAIDKKEADTKQKLHEEIRDLCTTYDHVPGARDMVSYPSIGAGNE